MNNLTYDDTLKNIVDKVNQNNSELSTKSSKLDWKIMTDAVDLNTMITDGRYLLKGTITNGYTGVSGWHYLIVESIPNNNRVTQTIWHDDGTEAYTRRLKSDGTWTSWLLESNTSNAVSVINQSTENTKIQASKIDIDGLVKGNNAITNRIGEVETDINNRISATNEKVSVNSTNIANETKRATDKENELNTKVEDYHSEVVDARSGYDGTKYGTLGDSIRKQFEGFKLENLRVGGRNLLASRNIIKNAFIVNGLSLEDGNDGNHYAYNLIEAKAGDKFTITSYADTNDTVIGYFNADKICMERDNSSVKGQPKTVVVPEGAVYIAVSLPNKYPHGLCKLERYSIPTDYTPAPEDLTTYMKKEEGSLKVAAGMTEIQTNIKTYNDLSMLFVFANGIALSSNDYSVRVEEGNTCYIYLKEGPKEPTTITWICYNLMGGVLEDYSKLKGDKGDPGSIDGLGIVTPEMFGAVGDGINDDTTAIQNAIDSGKFLMIPPKTYKVNGLVAKDGLYMIGTDINNSILYFESGSFTGNPNNNNLYNGGVIRNLTIKGNNTDESQNGFDLIMITSTIERVIAKNFKGTGFKLGRPLVAWYQPMVNNGECHGLTRCTANRCGTGFDLKTYDAIHNDLVASWCDVGASVSECRISNLHVWGFRKIGLELLDGVFASNLEVEAALTRTPEYCVKLSGTGIVVSNFELFNMRVDGYLIHSTYSKYVQLKALKVGDAGILTDADATKIQLIDGIIDNFILDGMLDSSYTSGTGCAVTGENIYYDLLGNSNISNLTKTKTSMLKTKDISVSYSNSAINVNSISGVKAYQTIAVYLLNIEKPTNVSTYIYNGVLFARFLDDKGNELSAGDYTLRIAYVK